MEGQASASKFKNICVFCGSSTGNKECYKDATIELGQELVSKKIGLVYGGGNIGLMGLVSQTVRENGGEVLGIIPRALKGKEVAGDTIGNEILVDTMHRRKELMIQHADCFIALPGGYGTFEELLEVLSLAQLGIHNKPIGLLNTNGFYNSLLTFVDHAIENEFIKPLERNLFVHASNAKELIQKLEEYDPCKMDSA